jgi:hypothetical protein
MNKNTLAILLVVSMMPGIILLISLSTNSLDVITGNVVADEYISSVCSIDSDCSGSQVCCKFNNENSGACYDSSKCSQIFEVTNINTNSNDRNNAPLLELPTRVIYSSKLIDSVPVAIFFGFSIAILCLAVGYLISILSHKLSKKNSITHKNYKNNKTNFNSKLQNNKTSNHVQLKLSEYKSLLSKKTRLFHKYSNLSEDILERYIVSIVGIVAFVAIVIMLL